MFVSSATSSDGSLTAARSSREYVTSVYTLAKPRLAAMSVLTTMIAYATAPHRLQTGSLVATVLGTSLAAAGALSFNQWWERDTDAVMQRTRSRPLPLRSLSPTEALAWSAGFSLGGVALLAIAVNLAAAALAGATIVIYGAVYTPLKRRTRWATEIGSISGALPALLGSAAAGDLWSRPGLSLTATLLFWQMPHFFAIGWKHRLDYRAVGFPLLPAIDAGGKRTALWSFAYTLLLTAISLAPWTLGWFGGLYGAIAALANGCFLLSAWRFVAARDRDRSARNLFLTSLLYLPAMMAATLLDVFLRH